MKTSLKKVAVGIGIIVTFILLYFLITGVPSMFTKSNGTGGEDNMYVCARVCVCLCVCVSVCVFVCVTHYFYVSVILLCEHY